MWIKCKSERLRRQGEENTEDHQLHMEAERLTQVSPSETTSIPWWLEKYPERPHCLHRMKNNTVYGAKI